MGSYHGWELLWLAVRQWCDSATVRQCDSEAVRVRQWRLSSSLHLPFLLPVILNIGYLHSRVHDVVWPPLSSVA